MYIFIENDHPCFKTSYFLEHSLFFFDYSIYLARRLVPSLPNNPKILDASHAVDLDFRDYCGKPCLINILESSFTGGNFCLIAK